MKKRIVSIICALSFAMSGFGTAFSIRSDETSKDDTSFVNYDAVLTGNDFDEGLSDNSVSMISMNKMPLWAV